jgi:hypothetical protein
MAGGNPRTLGVLYTVLESHMSDDVLGQLSAMLDTFTGWYQVRTEELPMQSRTVFDALALNWDPMTVVEISVVTGLDTPSVSSQMSRLEKSAYAEAVSQSKTKKGRNAYQVHAFCTLLEGEDYLLLINPEVRGMAETIYKDLAKHHGIFTEYSRARKYFRGHRASNKLGGRARLLPILPTAKFYSARNQICERPSIGVPIKPRTFSFFPPSISSALLLYTLPLSGSRIWPPTYSLPSFFKPFINTIPTIGWSLRASVHLSHFGFWISSGAKNSFSILPCISPFTSVI